MAQAWPVPDVTPPSPHPMGCCDQCRDQHLSFCCNLWGENSAAGGTYEAGVAGGHLAT